MEQTQQIIKTEGLKHSVYIETYSDNGEREYYQVLRNQRNGLLTIVVKHLDFFNIDTHKQIAKVKYFTKVRIEIDEFVKYYYNMNVYLKLSFHNKDLIFKGEKK